MRTTHYFVLTMLLAFSLQLSASSHHLSHTKPSTDMKYTIVILYRVTPAFLHLKRTERNQFFADKVFPIVAQFSDQLTIRMYDSEAFHATTSDYLIIECSDLKDYYFFMENLRDTELFGKPYIELQDVIMGIEDGFTAFESTN